ncbi:gluconolaconase [Nocardioides sp. BGMRC 2183]|nr:gluconolaconase [Nocardioides sp. BGMRC 2183]
MLAATALGALGAGLGASSPAYADQRGDHGRAATYLLAGDPVDADNPAGSKFEGIGADERRGRFYVSEVTGGEIHRGQVGVPRTQEWLGGDGVDGRYTARGIAVDAQGRVYIAGGPNGIGDGGVDNGRPDLWVYGANGRLLAALRTPGEDVFLNDVTIGPDGAAYFTDSNDAQIFRVADGRNGWAVRRWADATDTIARETGFNLGGIVLTRDQKAFVVAQGNTGKLWRFTWKDRKVSRVRTGGADLVNADGLVLRGNRLLVVRNFSKRLAHLQLSPDGRKARLVRQRATAPDRVLTTAAELRGQVLYVDSKFDEEVASAPYEVIADPTR